MMIKILLILLIGRNFGHIGVISKSHEVRFNSETENLKSNRPEFPITVYSEDKGKYQQGL
ncbi:MAG: hypothetical protein IPJ07_25420 [Acidobacteria bacterium]|nr:hypothetical protein [Acidobacteriota bacterium]